MTGLIRCLYVVSVRHERAMLFYKRKEKDPSVAKVQMLRKR